MTAVGGGHDQVGPAGLLLDWYGVLTGPDASLVWQLAAAVRAAGHRTGVVSNVAGFVGPERERFVAMFDVLVASGEVGVDKPDPRILAIAAQRLGVAPARCVFVDDGRRNVAAAAGLGMLAVHHTDARSTAAVVRAAFGL